jgi:cytochrome c oxidase subunit 4
MSEATIQPRVYLVVYTALMVLLGITIAGAYIPLHWVATGLAFAIATVKAILIALYFMHLRESSTRVRVCAAAAVIWLGILIGGTLHDYLSRGWHPGS